MSKRRRYAPPSRRIMFTVAGLLLAMNVTGCTDSRTVNRLDELESQVSELSSRLDRLQPVLHEQDQIIASLRADLVNLQVTCSLDVTVNLAKFSAYFEREAIGSTTTGAVIISPFYPDALTGQATGRCR
jgi:uncharacterized coiled-coil protein SlyX